MKRLGIPGSGGLSVAFGLMTFACKGPVTSPEELAKIAESARAAAASAPPPPASSAAPEPAAPPPPLVPQPFKAEVPSALCSPAKSEICALDVFADVPATDMITVKRDATPKLIGWAAEGDAVPPVVIVQLAGPKQKFYAPASRITKRPDVATAKKAPALVDSGYDLIGVMQDVDPGTYAVHVLQVTSSGSSLDCDTRRQLKVE